MKHWSEKHPFSSWNMSKNTTPAVIRLPCNYLCNSNPTVIYIYIYIYIYTYRHIYIYIGPLINWCNPSCEVNFSIVLPSKVVMSLLYQFIKLALKSRMAVTRKGFFVLKFPMSFQNYQQKFQNCLEIDLRILKGLRSYKFYHRFAVQSSNICLNNLYI